MIITKRSRHIDAPPELVFAALADPQQIAGLIPRVRRVELRDRQANRARITTHMAIGPFPDIRNEGEVFWQPGREVIFRSQTPLPVEARWTLTPSGGGTDLEAMLTLDLAPLLGPLAAFVPDREVAAVIGPDLETALAEIERRVDSRSAIHEG